MRKYVDSLVQKAWSGGDKLRVVLNTYHSQAVKIFTPHVFAHSFITAHSQTFLNFTHSRNHQFNKCRGGLFTHLPQGK